MKPFRILGRNIRDAFKSVFRNFSLSIASITCIVITLFLVSIAIILSSNLNSFIQDLQNELTIVVHANKDSTDEDAAVINNKILAMDTVEEVVYHTKEEVRLEMIRDHEAFASIMENWTPETNPLLNRFKIKVTSIDEIKNTAEQIKEMENVYSVMYGEHVVDQIIPIFKIVERVAIVVVLALILVTAFLISNTIKLTIFARKSEIEIMRLVGTSNLVIRMPFLFEGLILGIIGAILPIIVSIYGYILFYDYVNGSLFSNIFILIKPLPFIFYLSVLLLGIGAIVGMVGSYRAVRKYLKI